MRLPSGSLVVVRTLRIVFNCCTCTVWFSSRRILSVFMLDLCIHINVKCEILGKQFAHILLTNT